MQTQHSHADSVSPKGDWEATEDAAFRRFILSAADHDTLSRERERELIVAAQSGDARAMNALLNHNVRALLKFISKYVMRGRKYGMAQGDLFNLAALALRKSVLRFDITRDFRLSTYAGYWVRAYIVRSFGDVGTLIRHPIGIVEVRHKIMRYSEAYAAKHGCEPGEEEIATALNVHVQRVRSAVEAPGAPASLDAVIMKTNGTEEASALQDFLADPSLGDHSQEDAAIRSQEAALVQEAIRCALTPRERFVLECREEDMALVEVAAAFAGRFGKMLTRERIRQIEIEARDKLRRFLEPRLRN